MRNFFLLLLTLSSACVNQLGTVSTEDAATLTPTCGIPDVDQAQMTEAFGACTDEAWHFPRVDERLPIEQRLLVSCECVVNDDGSECCAFKVLSAMCCNRSGTCRYCEEEYNCS